MKSHASELASGSDNSRRKDGCLLCTAYRGPEDCQKNLEELRNNGATI